ncbi:L-threonine 3-dehydrogenase [Aureococcus anophagefferens]|nr:L-threonine 3-dehydrogenase [Aureococcus anophagefferens]
MHTPEYLEERLRYELKQQEPAYDLKTTPQLPFAQDEENYTMEAWKDGAPAVPPLFEDVTQRPPPPPPAPHTILVIGAAGAIGRRLVTCEFGVDVRDEATIRAVVRKYKATLTTVWNLAAPLSVDTARDPSVARDVTVGGMERLLRAMKEESDATRMLFSDSIGSFGGAAPREDATARWLAEHPEQDPGSDYGRQKRGCRELMKEYATAHGFDCRWAVIPGVLHEDATWGGGTTEYALEAIRCAAEGAPFACPVPVDARLPMIHADDLVAGLLALMDAPRERLTNPEAGYALAGFSFAASELFAHLATLAPGFSHTVALDPAAAAFAALWPDRLGQAEAIADLGFVADIAFEETVDRIFQAHRARKAAAEAPSEPAAEAPSEPAAEPPSDPAPEAWRIIGVAWKPL